MLKVLIGGIAVGMANIIPGVSGGTMMVILGVFSRVMESINGLIKLDTKTLKKNVVFLVTLLIGVAIGLVFFANILEIAFANYPIQTMFCFVGMVAFSIPFLVKKEMKEDRFEIIPFVIGCAIIFLMSYFAPEETDRIITDFPELGLLYLIRMFFIGIIAGGVMFIPGVSGSMLLLIIGQYYLFKSLVANVTSFSIDVLIPIGFMGVGILVGIALSSKLTSYCLSKFHSKTMNFILGLVVSSTIVLIPLNVEYNLVTISSSLVTLLVGGAVVFGLERIAK